MKKVLFVFYTFLLCAITAFAQTKPQAFKAGEYLKFRVSYLFLNAGIAELKLSEVQYKGETMYHAKGIGYTTGLSKTFFKVYDDYQSYFEKDAVIPHRFIRKIDEGGYTKDQEGFFDYSKKNVLVKDYEKKKENTYPIVTDVQDIVSAFYYLRNHPKLDSLKKNEAVEIDMFFDGEVFRFKLLYLGTSVIKTKFGKVKALSFRPYVMAGRVFKEKESLTVWVSADANKVPLRIKAELAVGSLKADLEEYKGLVSTLKTEK
ncbi:DUF3108 domain-containing protein [Myroides sp. 1354]|uniref:DUF3108 domain-containing protein n=1 Tax=unclassified Myroides TaxID=2642485 RepID=UPI002577AB4C|nr:MULTISPECIES: DUF3108 domain-containing protein [unclassified Myroides]MDM1043534.1 DUF3108 domain-containing protein [Myroides sp. R163-1]MDM1054416.1 DUF3108 domain-containing protein [Myroides sp. 1354]MDM1067712.1 DUF3108 domain-containing protein [Myroides sp. 1372]